jgi:hypothetical protein
MNLDLIEIETNASKERAAPITATCSAITLCI